MYRCSTTTHFNQAKFSWQLHGFRKGSKWKATHLEGYNRSFLNMNCLRHRETLSVRYKQTARACSWSSPAPKLCTSPLHLHLSCSVAQSDHEPSDSTQQGHLSALLWALPPHPSLITPLKQWWDVSSTPCFGTFNSLRRNSKVVVFPVDEES